jgi:anti-sigma regulatory factor (Ser/Thr protein kinase)
MESGFSVNQCALPDAVPAVRAAVSRFLDPLDMPPARLADIGLAVSEACGNVVRHAYSGRVGALHCDGEIVGGEIVIRVVDWGGGFSTPSSHGGLGLGMSLMEQLADAMLVTRSEGQTVVVLRFQRAG